MYREDIIETIQSGELGNGDREQLVGEFYSANLSLIHVIAQEQCLTSDDYYDCLQLGYDAIHDALKVYKPGKYSFLSYFRRAFKHRCYLYNLEFRYPVRIKSPNEASNFNYTFISYGTDPVVAEDYCEYSSNCYEAENKIMHECIIAQMKQDLNSLQYLVLVEVFWGNMTKKAIAEKFSWSVKAVRNAYISGLNKLKKNKKLQRIANDMYGIRSDCT